MRSNKKFFNNSKILPVDKFIENVLYNKKSSYYSSKIPFGKGICGRTAKSNEAYISADVSKESNYISCNIGVKSEIVVPIFNNKKVNIGQVDIDSNNINHFSKSDLIFLETINNFISKKFFK